jgi:hypothetical protein
MDEIFNQLGFTDLTPEKKGEIENALFNGVKEATGMAIDNMEGVDDTMKWLIKDQLASGF